jgi:DNA replication protein DnaC
VLVTAKTQRWKPEEFLRTLIEAEIASRDLSNARGRMKVAAFPVTKTLEEFDVAASSVKRATFDYLASLEWIRAKENLCLVGPAGTGKSHLLVALGHQAVEAGHRVRYFTATELVETLYRAWPTTRSGKVIAQILKADLILIDEIGFAPMDGPAPSSSSAWWPPPTNAGSSASARTGPSRTGGSSSPSTPPRSACSTGCSITA